MGKPLFVLLLTGLLSSAAFAGQPLTNISTVVIDSGHADDGVGRKGDSSGKTRCAQVALALKDIIERENGTTVKTVLTLKADSIPNQRERAFTANSNSASVYVSIHEYSANQAVAGVFSPSPSSDDGPPTWKDAGAKYLQKSALLAEKVRATFEAAFPGQKYFVGYAPLATFYGVSAPAVAIEAVPRDPKAPWAPEQPGIVATVLYTALLEYGRFP